MNQILRALNYMHKENLVHRDIKPENILFTKENVSDLTVKLTDFGFANFYDPEEGGFTDVLGTPMYMAPEIIQKKKYDHKVDIWAAGVVAYVMLTGRPPFRAMSKKDLFDEIVDTEVEYDPQMWKTRSEGCLNFVK